MGSRQSPEASKTRAQLHLVTQTKAQNAGFARNQLRPRITSILRQKLPIQRLDHTLYKAHNSLCLRWRGAIHNHMLTRHSSEVHGLHPKPAIDLKRHTELSSTTMN